MPDPVRHRVSDGPPAGEPTTERGEIERLERRRPAVQCGASLDWTVIETRFDVVRSLMPCIVTAVCRPRDYLPPVDQRDPPT